MSITKQTTTNYLVPFKDKKTTGTIRISSDTTIEYTKVALAPGIPLTFKIKDKKLLVRLSFRDYNHTELLALYTTLNSEDDGDEFHYLGVKKRGASLTPHFLNIDNHGITILQEESINYYIGLQGSVLLALPKLQYETYLIPALSPKIKESVHKTTRISGFGRYNSKDLLKELLEYIINIFNLYNGITI